MENETPKNGENQKDVIVNPLSRGPIQEHHIPSKTSKLRIIVRKTQDK